jgi:hypothetical protein
MASELDEIDIGGHSHALAVETEGKQAEAPANPASKTPLNIKTTTVADTVTRRAALPRAAEDGAAASHRVDVAHPSGKADGRLAEAGKTIVDEHHRSVEPGTDQAKALVALVRLLARLAAREAWDTGRDRRHDPAHDTPKAERLPPSVRP